MRKNFKVILDCDDVLYHCNSIAVNRLNKERNTNYSLYDINEWGVLGNDLDERLRYFTEPEFIGSLPLKKGAKEFVHELSKKAEIFIATNVNHACAGARFESILRNFPEISAGNIIIGGRKDLLVADMRLDDATFNLENANVEFPVLMQQPWNYVSGMGMLSVNGYDEFLKLVDIIKDSKYNLNSSRKDLVSLIGACGSGKKNVLNSLLATGRFKRVDTYTTKSSKSQDSEGYIYMTSAEFLLRKEQGYFSETSSYMGDFYGVRDCDIQNIIDDGFIPVLIIDVNGAMAIRKSFNTLNVFVKAPKVKCIENILCKGLPTDEAAKKIVALDFELHNENLCDLVIVNEDINLILEELKEGN